MLGWAEELKRRVPLVVRDVVRLLDHLKIAHAHIVGYSMGGSIATSTGRQANRVKCPNAAAPGVRFGSYEVLAPLGAGGMGADPLWPAADLRHELEEL